MENHLDNHINEEFLMESIGELDVLATHYSTECVHLNNTKIINIDYESINISIEGEVEVSLIYGSSSDHSNGEGATINECFPFTCILEVSVDNPDDFHIIDNELKVDTNSWHEG